ncbi:MAG: hypothetical protein Q8O67_11740 [Deltaproteobacteria bacterium]|nr:hypothetical protein [Deltaproteobacteria bacterium]
MAKPKEISDFKFRYCRGGQPAGIFASKACVADDGLRLGESRIAWEFIADTTTRDDRLLLVVSPGADLDKDAAKSLVDGCALVLAPNGVKALDLERAIDRRASRAEIDRTKKKLEAEGRLSEFRSINCPHCDATVNLSAFPETRHVFCRFCDTLFVGRTRTVVTDDHHRICSECNLFDHVQGYTEFYFYFLLVVYGFSYKRRHLCAGCAGRLFWKVLLINTIFVLGIPPAVWMKVKSMSGKSATMKSLAAANVKNRRGDVAAADALYAEVLKGMPEHPGVLHNQAHAHFKAGDADGGARALRKSLDSCSNYNPSLGLVAALAQGEPPAQLT